MYLAGELPPQDRADVEQTLAADPGMREELERLRETVGQVEAALAHLDAVERLPMTSEAAASRVGRLATRWNADRAAARAAAERGARPGQGVPRWAFPAAAVAACALVSWGIWWASNSGSQRVLPPDVVTTQSTTDEASGEEKLASLLPYLVPADAIEDDPDFIGPDGTPPSPGPTWASRLDALEADVYALSNDREGDSDGVDIR